MRVDRRRTILDSGQLAVRTAPLLEHGVHIPLLVVRLPEFSETAWRSGTRFAQQLERATTAAFRRSSREVARAEDVLIHDVRSDWFGIAMLSPARGGDAFTSTDARAALDRIAAAIALSTGRKVETGWHSMTEPSDVQTLSRTIERALERGAHERERYEFFAAVGHELRTPLTSIRGYIESLLDEDVDAATQPPFLGNGSYRSASPWTSSRRHARLFIARPFAARCDARNL